MDRAFSQPLDVPALARLAHVSPAHFSREFRRAFGETPHQYLLTRRLERAAALLRNTDRSVADICLTVEPPLAEYPGGHLAACHHPQNITAAEIAASHGLV